MVPAMGVCLYKELYVPSAIIFLTASVTDVVDGFIARHFNQVTDFGKFFDPLADKLLSVTAPVSYTHLEGKIVLLGDDVAEAYFTRIQRLIVNPEELKKNAENFRLVYTCLLYTSSCKRYSLLFRN